MMSRLKSGLSRRGGGVGRREGRSCAKFASTLTMYLNELFILHLTQTRWLTHSGQQCMDTGILLYVRAYCFDAFERSMRARRCVRLYTCDSTFLLLRAMCLQMHESFVHLLLLVFACVCMSVSVWHCGQETLYFALTARPVLSQSVTQQFPAPHSSRLEARHTHCLTMKCTFPAYSPC